MSVVPGVECFDMLSNDGGDLLLYAALYKNELLWNPKVSESLHRNLGEISKNKPEAMQISSRTLSLHHYMVLEYVCIIAVTTLSAAVFSGSCLYTHHASEYPL